MSFLFIQVKLQCPSKLCRGLSRCLEDGGWGSTCYISMRTLVIISGTHVKSWCSHALANRDRQPRIIGQQAEPIIIMQVQLEALSPKQNKNPKRKEGT